MAGRRTTRCSRAPSPRARPHRLPHEVLTGARSTNASPATACPPGSASCCSRRGGLIASERAIVAHARLAQAAGADDPGPRDGCLDWEAEPAGDGVTVRTDKGQYRAGRLVLAAGAWMADLARRAGRPAPCRSGRCWPGCSLRVRSCSPPSASRSSTCRWRRAAITAFPSTRCRASSSAATTTGARRWRRTRCAGSRTRRTRRLLRGFAERYFPSGRGATMALRACMFTNTPDEHFVLDRHPAFPQVVLASPCSGHGYKFCSAHRGDPGRPGHRGWRDLPRHRLPAPRPARAGPGGAAGRRAVARFRQPPAGPGMMLASLACRRRPRGGRRKPAL